MQLTDEDRKKLNNFLAERIKIQNDDLCFCGSGESYIKCCALQPNSWMSQEYLEKLIGFGEHENFNIQGALPTTFLSQLESSFEDQFNICGTPGCTKKSIYSHIFGKASLEKYFNSSTCQWYATNDDGVKELLLAGIKKEIGYKIFCSECDNNIFKQIDDIDHDNLDPKNQLLHIFRILGYQHQFNRAHLAFSHQVIYAVPQITEARNKHTGITPLENDISGHIKVFSDGYMRYKFTNSELEKLWKFMNGEIGSSPFFIVSKIISSKESFFAQGIENPQFDLLGNKINFLEHAAILYVVFPIDETHVQVVLASCYSEYIKLFEQLNDANEYRLKKFLITMIESKKSPRSVFVGVNKKAHQKVLR